MSPGRLDPHDNCKRQGKTQGTMKDINGTAVLTGDNVTTDMICPAQYRNGKKADLTKHVFKNHPGLSPKDLNGDTVLVAGDRFGAGSDPEAAARVLLACGVRCVIARSFPRDFFRPALNAGLPLITADLSKRIHAGDAVSVNLKKGIVSNGSEELSVGRYPERVLRIIQHGGLYRAVRKELGKD
jgi:3-isopropylmalate/(R)-2-methylmalate dehydratase small subunit